MMIHFSVIYRVIDQGYNLEQFVHHPDDLAQTNNSPSLYEQRPRELKESIYSQMWRPIHEFERPSQMTDTI